MSIDAAPAGLIVSGPDSSPSDLRIRHRYPIALPVQYKWTYRKTRGQLGSGTSVNISSRGILFRSSQALPVRSLVELALSWPVALNDRALKLVMRGRVVRTAGDTTAVQVAQYEFRISGSRHAAQGPVRGPRLL
ncbi:MAG TPA: PilZ domain-containing protein [Bryobacteraceae bacterium]|nr:PilZ domain-containing protein [Bryobacteraceae bacterium]